MTTITIQLTPEDAAALDEVLQHMAAFSDETTGPPLTREEVAQGAVYAWIHEQRNRIRGYTPPAGVLTHLEHTPRTV